MTASVDKPKPVETPPATDITDLDDVEALLEQADALATEAVRAVEAAAPVDLDESLAVAAVEPAADAPSAESQAPEKSAAKPGGIGGTLDDLDNLLQELGEQQPAIVVEEPVETEAAPIRAETAPEAQADEPDAARPDAPVDARAADAKEEDANPYAGEVAQLEKRWSAETTTRRKTAPAKPTQSEAGPAAASVDRPPRPPGRIVRGTLGAVAWVLDVFDIPFAWISPRFKNIIGYTALASLAVAAVVWLAGPHVAQYIANQPASAGSSEQTAPAPAAGAHNPAPIPKSH